MLVIPPFIYEPRPVGYCFPFSILRQLIPLFSIAINELLRQRLLWMEINLLPLYLRVKNENDMSAVVCRSKVGKLFASNLLKANFKIGPSEIRKTKMARFAV